MSQKSGTSLPGFNVGPVIVVVDQRASIGALPVRFAESCGAAVAYLRELAMRRIADLHPGEAGATLTAVRAPDAGPDGKTLTILKLTMPRVTSLDVTATAH